MTQVKIVCCRITAKLFFLGIDEQRTDLRLGKRPAGEADIVDPPGQGQHIEIVIDRMIKRHVIGRFIRPNAGTQAYSRRYTDY